MRLSQDAGEKEDLISEIKRAHDSMDELSCKHRSLIEDVAARDDHVAKLEVRTACCCHGIRCLSKSDV